MDSKNILVTVIVAALVTIIVSLGMNGLQLSPSMGKATPVGSYSSSDLVNANECTKDGVCEVNSLVSFVTDGSGNSSSSTTITAGNIDTNNINTADLIASGSVSGFVVSGTYGVSGGWIQQSDSGQYVTLNHGGIEATALRHPNWSTTPPGTQLPAYACLDAQGNFFRSQTPCV